MPSFAGHGGADLAGSRLVDVEHSRTQYPVGEGLFHAGSVASGDARLHYVYDCGSQSSYTRARTDAIRSYQNDLGGRDIALLYLSHAHADHVSGVPALLTGTRARTIVLPFLNASDRLVAFVRAQAHGQDDDFFRRWVADPVGTVAGLGPDRIIEVGATTPGAPGLFGGTVGGEPETPDWSDDASPEIVLDVDTGADDVQAVPDEWELRGRGRVFGDVVDGTIVLRVPDTIAIQPKADGQLLPWLLATHVSTTVATGRDSFLECLADRMGHTVDVVETLLTDPAEIQKLLDERDTLVAAYSSVRKDLNLTSLCLYSGPPPSVEDGMWHYEAHRPGGVLYDWWPYPWPWRGAAWLGTGDAKLSAPVHRDALTTHFAAVGKQVRTMTLAHHGALNGFSDELLREFRASTWVAPAAPYSNWQHPHPRVERAVELAGRTVIHVDGDADSRFDEWCRFSPIHR